MDSRKVSLHGSPLRDAFRLWHKDYLGKGYYASDGDLFLVNFEPPKVIALLDIKHPNDELLTDTEIILYDTMVKVGIPVKIVTGIWKANKIPFDGNKTCKAELISDIIVVVDYSTGKTEFQGNEQGYRKYEDDLRRGKGG